jgi:hypothetical protein
MSDGCRRSISEERCRGRNGFWDDFVRVMERLSPGGANNGQFVGHVSWPSQKPGNSGASNLVESSLAEYDACDESRLNGGWIGFADVADFRADGRWI